MTYSKEETHTITFSKLWTIWKTKNLQISVASGLILQRNNGSRDVVLNAAGIRKKVSLQCSIILWKKADILSSLKIRSVLSFVSDHN
jgi:hypothetical protein